MATPKSTPSANYDVEMEALKTDLKMLREDIAALTNTVAGDIKVGAQAKAEELTSQARAKAEEIEAEFRDQSEQLVSQIQANPLQSIGIAVGLGFLVGLILRR